MTMITATRARLDLWWIPLSALVLAFSTPLLGQTYEQVAPKAVRPGLPAVTAQPAPAAQIPVADPNQILVPRLTGLRLVPDQSQISKEAVPAGQPLGIDGLPWLDQKRAEAAITDYIGRPLTRKDLSELVRKLVLVCRKSNRPVVDIFAPPQDISTGVVQLIVMVGKLGALHVEGNQWFKSTIFTRDIRVQPGQEITGEQILEDMDFINQNPFRQVDLVYARGADFGLTDVILRVRDQMPDRVYVGYDDTGNETTGLGRVFAGFNMGNLFGDDQQLSYQYTRSTDFNRLQAHSASYALPLPWRNTLEIFGDWADARTEAESGLFELNGVNWQVGVRYTIPLPMIGPTFTEAISFGADYKWSNNDLDFGGTQVFTSPINVAQGVLSYSWALVDSRGSTQGSVTGFYGPGGVGGLNHDSNFAVQRAGAPAQYGYVQVNVTRVERLPDSYTLVLTTLSQWASARLVPSNEFGLGGALSVRGYDERIVNGDDGVSGQLELRTPPRHLLDQIPDSTQALIFLDAGRAWQHNLLPGETDNTLSSVGPGLRMTIGSHGTIKADYGWQLERLPGTRHGRIHLSAVISY